MKGPGVSDELILAEPVIRRLGGGVPSTHASGVDLLGGHVILEIVKVAATPSAYPRRPLSPRARTLG